MSHGGLKRRRTKVQNQLANAQISRRECISSFLDRYFRHLVFAPVQSADGISIVVRQIITLHLKKVF